MNPGATTSPRASMRVPFARSRPSSGCSEMAAMRSPFSPTCRTASSPLSGSMTRPPASTTSRSRSDGASRQDGRRRGRSLARNPIPRQRVHRRPVEGLRGDGDPPAENGGLLGSETQVEALAAVRERPLSEVVGGEEAIASGVPIGGRAGVLRMVEDRHRHVFIAGSAREGHPAAARAPDRVAFFPLAAPIETGDSGVVEGDHGGGPPGGVGQGHGLLRGLLEKAGDTQSEETLLVVLEQNRLASGREPRRALDDAAARAPAEDEGGVLVEDDRPSRQDPLHGHPQPALVFPVLRAHHANVPPAAHLRLLLGGPDGGVVPEIHAVDVAEVEPQADVVGMVGALAGPRIEGEAAGDGRAAIGQEWVEDGLGERLGPDVRGEGLAVDLDVHAPVHFAGNHLHGRQRDGSGGPQAQCVG